MLTDGALNEEKCVFSPQPSLWYQWSHTVSTAATPGGLDTSQRDGKAQEQQTWTNVRSNPSWMSLDSGVLMFEVQHNKHWCTPSGPRVGLVLRENKIISEDEGV